MISARSRQSRPYGNLVVGLLVVLFAACSDASSVVTAPAATPVQVTGPIGRDGGILTDSAGLFILLVPRFAVSTTSDITVSRVADPPADARVVPNTAFEISPKRLYFTRDAKLTLRYNQATFPTALAFQSLELSVLTEDGWHSVNESKLDSVGRSVTGTIFGAGIYALRSTVVDRIVLNSAQVNGALYVGQTALLRTLLYTIDGQDLPSRPLHWTSSAPLVISVDGAGNITAHTLGTATISALVDGRSASTTITVLNRPSSNWESVTEWSTYQGSAGHNGYVAVTVDPVVFKERWVKTPFAEITFNQATSGAGRVYLVTDEGSRKVLALNSVDGTQLWVRELGPINGSNQATYDGTSVYVTTGGHEDTFMYAFNAGNGAQLFKTPFLDQFSRYRAPVIAGRAIVTAGGYYGGMYGFDRVTGAQLFFNSGAQVDLWAPSVKDNLLYITDGALSAISPENGALLNRIIDPRVNEVSTPVVGGANNILTLTQNRLVSVDLARRRVLWDVPATGGFVPVVGRSVVYSVSGSNIVAARDESTGALLWSWVPPAPYTLVRSMLLTNNVLFVGIAPGSDINGITVAIDLTSHLAVWGYPLLGELSLSAGQSTLYIMHGGTIGAISLR